MLYFFVTARGVQDTDAGLSARMAEMDPKVKDENFVEETDKVCCQLF